MKGPADLPVRPPAPTEELATGIATLPGQARAIDASAATICTVIEVIAPEVATVAATHPAPAAALTAGHRQIAGEATAIRAQAAGVTATAESLDALNRRVAEVMRQAQEAHARELAASQAETAKARDELASSKSGSLRVVTLIGAALIPAGLLVIFLMRAVALGVGLVGAGVGTVALVRLLAAHGQLLGYLLGGVILVAVAAIAYRAYRQHREDAERIERERQARELQRQATHAAVGFGELLKAGHTPAAAAAIAKREVPRPVRDLIREELPDDPRPPPAPARP